MMRMMRREDKKRDASGCREASGQGIDRRPRDRDRERSKTAKRCRKVRSSLSHSLSSSGTEDAARKSASPQENTTTVITHPHKETQQTAKGTTRDQENSASNHAG